MKKIFFILFLIPIIITSVTSCGVSQKHWHNIEQQMRYGELEDATLAIDEKKESEYGERNAVLYYLDKAILLHHLGKYQESTKYFDLAEKKIDDLYTVSISNQAASLTTNDNLVPYDGEDFEEALLNLFTALNFAYAGDWENALVEGRQVDHQLQVLSDRYEKENKDLKEDEKPTKVVYTEDAFIRYLMGLFFEAQGEYNDALIFFRKAYEAYQKYEKYYNTKTPEIVIQDYLRQLKSSGLKNEFAEIQKKHPGVKYLSRKEYDKHASVIFIHYAGFAPYKEDEVVGTAQFGYIAGPNVALPYYVPRPPYIQKAQIKLKGKKEYIQETVLAENITKIAVRNLEDRYPSIVRRAIARLVIKEGVKFATKVMSKADNDTVKAVGTVLNIGTIIAAWATERADKRSWRLLPASINIARVYVKPGKYKLDAKFLNKYNNPQFSESFGEMTLQSKEIKVIGFRTYR
ncbi:MAG: hypothetical protein ABIA04_01670 [Pseudomonadota bacterium]